VLALDADDEQHREIHLAAIDDRGHGIARRYGEELGGNGRRYARLPGGIRPVARRAAAEVGNVIDGGAAAQAPRLRARSILRCDGQHRLRGTVARHQIATRRQT